MATSTPSSVTAPPVGIVEAQRQLEERRLAGARGADDGDDLARRDAEAHVPQHGSSSRPGIGEVDRFEGELAASRLREPGAARPARRCAA